MLVLEQLRAVLEQVRRKQPETLEMFKRNGIVFQGDGGHWEQVAFSVYTTLCEVALLAHQTLESLDEEDGAPARKETP